MLLHPSTMALLLVTMVQAQLRYMNREARELLEGPATNARIIPFSDQIQAEDLPLEHRLAGDTILLPDVFSIPRNLTTELNVDLFFSLFFVFLNDRLEETDSPFTIFAPAALETSEASRWLGTEEKLTEELLLNHIVLGEHLRPELITSWNLVRSTLGGLDVAYTIDDDGQSLIYTICSKHSSRLIVG
jgi:hypothetical protein